MRKNDFFLNEFLTGKKKGGGFRDRKWVERIEGRS